MRIKNLFDTFFLPSTWRHCLHRPQLCIFYHCLASSWRREVDNRTRERECVCVWKRKSQKIAVVKQKKKEKNIILLLFFSEQHRLRTESWLRKHQKNVFRTIFIIILDLLAKRRTFHLVGKPQKPDITFPCFVTLSLTSPTHSIPTHRHLQSWLGASQVELRFGFGLKGHLKAQITLLQVKSLSFSLSMFQDIIKTCFIGYSWNGLASQEF